MSTLTNCNKSFSSFFKYLLIFIVTITVFFAIPKSSDIAYADMGPKPSVHITFKNMGDEPCYGTLLSNYQSTGPHGAWNGESECERIPDDFTREIWLAFVEYEDADGYYFLQNGWKCSETKKIHWGYYPPYNFKILLYYPDSDTFVVSGIYERYAFNSYYTVNMDGIDIHTVETTETLTAKRSYHYVREALALILRIVVTILIEIGVALLFRFKDKKVLKVIIATNIVTQILLNVALNIIRFYEGALTFIIFYFILEFFVFLIEAIVYKVAFNRVSPTKVSGWKSLIYAFIANVLSFGAGFLIAILETMLQYKQF